MSKLFCKCGHVIADQEVNLSYKAAIIPDKLYFDFSDKIQEGIESLIEATKNDKRKEWIEKNFAAPPYPMDLTDAQMIGDIFDRFYYELRRVIYQCEKCGRIWIQDNKSEFFKPFLPEINDWKDVLSNNDTKEEK